MAKGTGKRRVGSFQYPIDKDTAAFYRRKAKEAGVTVSEFLRNTLHEGVVAENVQDVEDRIRARIASIPGSMESPGQGLTDEIALSIITSEALLSAIVEAQDPQALYRAHDAARVKLRKIKGVSNG
ncbi:MAG: hypothetical protein JWM42_1317 [Burkholderia sp.]|nr:hypothetical protein [Burkholderia sp.]